MDGVDLTVVPPLPTETATTMVDAEMPDGADPNTTGADKKEDQEGTCRKCCGNHLIKDCPHYRGDHGKHNSAHQNDREKEETHTSGDDGYHHVPNSDAEVKVKPSDGSCVFHSLTSGTGQNATEL